MLNRHVKLFWLLLAIGIFGSRMAEASDSSNQAALSVTAENKFQMDYPKLLSKIEPPPTTLSKKWEITRIFSRVIDAFKIIGRATAEEVKSDLIIRYGNDSSRAWTTIAHSQPNPTLCGDCSTHEPTFGVSFHFH